MGEKRYIISDASRMVDVEAHVLRYWEEELEIEIPRNEMGHRYYTEFHIQLLKSVKELKEQGLQLKAIKMIMPELLSGEEVSIDKVVAAHDINSNEIAVNSNQNMPEIHKNINAGTKIAQFQQIINEAVSQAMLRNTEILSDSISGKVNEGMSKEMDYLFRMQDEREDERFKKFDELVRGYQRGSKEAAMTLEKPKKKSKFFKKYSK